MPHGAAAVAGTIGWRAVVVIMVLCRLNDQIRAADPSTQAPNVVVALCPVGGAAVVAASLVLGFNLNCLKTITRWVLASEQFQGHHLCL